MLAQRIQERINMPSAPHHISVKRASFRMVSYIDNAAPAIKKPIKRADAAIAVTTFSIVTVVSRVLFGVFADILDKKHVLAFSMFLTAVGLVIFQTLDGTSFVMIVVFAVIYGVGAAGAMPLRTPIIREYFGVKRFGTIFGLLAFFLTIGSAAGAPVAGWVYDTQGVYNPIWYIYAGLSVVGMFLIKIMKKPVIE